MSLSYRAVDWNRHKRYYDGAAGVVMVLIIGLFCGITCWRSPSVTAETLVIRSSALAAIFLLHVILCIGPLARFDARFLPLLYNRRHLGVAMFCFGLIHGGLAVFQFHAWGNENPFISLFTAYGRDYRASGGLGQAPFEPFGAAALIILFLMAATSHDFWLKNLGASVWKALHLGVYIAYGLLLAHVWLGVVQYERSAAFPLLLAAGFAVVAGLHLAAAIKEAGADRRRAEPSREGFVDVCAAGDVQEGRGKVVLAGGRRLAVFRHEARFYATSNVCRHQGGPVGEGRIVDGCITCPWHGWNYRPEDGCSPPPFHEVLPTYEVRVIAGRVWLRPEACPVGTRCSGAPADGSPAATAALGRKEP